MIIITSNLPRSENLFHIFLSSHSGRKSSATRSRWRSRRWWSRTPRCCGSACTWSTATPGTGSPAICRGTSTEVSLSHHTPTTDYIPNEYLIEINLDSHAYAIVDTVSPIRFFFIWLLPVQLMVNCWTGLYSPIWRKIGDVILMFVYGNYIKIWWHRWLRNKNVNVLRCISIYILLMFFPLRSDIAISCNDSDC